MSRAALALGVLAGSTALVWIAVMTLPHVLMEDAAVVAPSLLMLSGASWVAAREATKISSGTAWRVMLIGPLSVAWLSAAALAVYLLAVLVGG